MLLNCSISTVSIFLNNTQPYSAESARHQKGRANHILAVVLPSYCSYFHTSCKISSGRIQKVAENSLFFHNQPHMCVDQTVTMQHFPTTISVFSDFWEIPQGNYNFHKHLYKYYGHCLKNTSSGRPNLQHHKSHWSS